MGDWCSPTDFPPTYCFKPGCGRPECIKGKSKVGRKDDQGKLTYGAVPPYALHEVVKVLTYGAKKYGRENWAEVSDLETRYRDALGRHLAEWDMGHTTDSETACHHLAHAVCCLLFILECQLTQRAIEADWQSREIAFRDALAALPSRTE